MVDRKKKIQMPGDWWQAFVDQAAKEGMSVSAWLRGLGYEKLPRKVRDKLSEPPKMGRPRKSEPEEE